ncbi:NTF2 fold immunity protein [Algoriella xinjiangensis]|uniref:NTF2 fold immunity protein n=1 Tax=Algoriella xinjiangensis TaxID=684065 RepID=A0A1I4WA70_9FLAO|nr:hypothetical protein [Algoriella xinjiangensis]SFN10283.1 NTF2 fold immunity protein [Algoriella xinjiangensis]VDH15425.1 Uncharacterised protein [Algoriella xinjiangensis]
MGMLDKLFGKKQNAPKNEVANETSQIENNESNEIKNNSVEKLNIDTSQTLEKFLHMTDEILKFLINKLQEINSLEQEIFERSKSLKNPKEPNQLQPGEKELWAEYAKRRKEITNPISLNQSEEGSRSFGKPTKYEYLNYPNTQISFIMKSANRAVIEIIYEYGIKSKDQFILKKEGENWKIDSKKYGFPDESTWHKDEL